MSVPPVNRQILLNSRPKGMIELENFELKESPMPKPQVGEVLIQTLYLSVDPYMRGRMSDRPSYMPPFEIGSPFEGGAIGRVVESHNPKLKVGDVVVGQLKWADYSIANAVDLQHIDPRCNPMTTALGILGMTGMTAYFGLFDIGQPKAGDTVVISGAAGAVGSLVGQIAKLKGCRVIGVAGSQEKVHYITKELGFDAGISYRTPGYHEELKRECPRGVQIYFDNVGGDLSDHVYPLLSRNSRIVLCGQIAEYNLEKPDIGPRPFVGFLMKAVTLKGMSVVTYHDRFPEAVAEISNWLKEGKVKYREHIIEGLENTPKALLGLFHGDNIGKQLVKI